jgi:hypothetical protein
MSLEIGLMLRFLIMRRVVDLRRDRMMDLEPVGVLGGVGQAGREDGDGGWIRIVVEEGQGGGEEAGMGLMGMAVEGIGIEMEETIVDRREDRDLIGIEVGDGRNVTLAVFLQSKLPEGILYKTTTTTTTPRYAFYTLGICLPSTQSPLFPPLFSMTLTPSIRIPLSTLLHIS